MVPKQIKQMVIACACDEAFLPHTATMLSSLLENAELPPYIYLLHDGISVNELDKLAHFVEQRGGVLEALVVDTDSLKSLKIDKHASVANYFRLLLPKVLPDTVDKVLYLDSDIIVRKSLSRLWQTQIEQHPLAAVENPTFCQHARLGMPLASKYFNSGVLLLNLSKWREQGIHLAAIDFIRKCPEVIEYWDQDGLNAVLCDQWLELPLYWNVQHNLFLDPGLRIRYADIVADPAIVHFSGQNLKPWQCDVEHPFKNLYTFYRSKTPWNLWESQRKQGKLQFFKGRLRQEVIRKISLLADLDAFWTITQPFFRASKILLSHREQVLQQRNSAKEQRKLREEITLILPDQVVVSGPFAGLEYSEIESVGSTLAPKLLGTYEAELHPVIDDICQKQPSVIINIGCAEGYYAVGLAKRIANAKVFAYDPDSTARELCHKLATLNDVADRVVIGEFFTMRSLPKPSPDSHGVIVCDCEGAERYIFYKDTATWPYLSRFDILIEAYEFLQPGVSRYLLALFSETHCIERILSVEDALRPRIFRCNRLEDQDFESRIRLMAERRPGTMEWFYMKRKR